jgi:hypothetical protein
MKILNTLIQEEGSFDYDENNIVFNTVPEYKKYLNAEYQYLLEGFRRVNGVQNRCEFQKPVLASMYLKLGLNLPILYRAGSYYSFFTVLSLGMVYRRVILYLIIGIVLARIMIKLIRVITKRKKTN